VERDADQMITGERRRLTNSFIQLNEILTPSSTFRSGRHWRGIKYLIEQSETGTLLKIRV